MDYLVSSFKLKNDLYIILGVFLLILAVSGNFIAESVSCKMRSFLSENMYAKNVIIVFIIYFSLGLVSDKNIIPTKHLKDSIGIWILFIIFNKMSIPFTVITFILLFLTLVCKNWIDYYNANDKEKNKEYIRKIDILSQYLLFSTIVTIIVGFLLYFRKQYSEHYKNFNFVTFILGKVHCDSS